MPRLVKEENLKKQPNSMLSELEREDQTEPKTDRRKEI